MSTSRVEAFSDGVLAIAITLLVLDLKASDHRGHVAQDLVGQWPSYVAYVASFLYIGVVWINHHALFRRIQAVDAGLLGRNLLLLLAASTLPFPTAELAATLRDGTHQDQVAAIALYAVVAASTAGGWLLLFHHLHRRPELRAGHVSEAFFRDERGRAVVGLVSPLVPVLVALASPLAALGVILLTPVFYALTSDGLPRRRMAA